MAMDGESFPRGRVTPAVSNAQKGKLEDSTISRMKGNTGDLFVSKSDKVTKSEVKVDKKKHKLTAVEERIIAGGKRSKMAEMAFQVVPLSYDQLVPDMLMLGVISFVQDHWMQVTMPGHTTGVVNITDISRPLEKMLEKAQKALHKGHTNVALPSLLKQFKTGQVVVVKVKSVGKMENGLTDVSLSMNPRDIQANFSLAAIKKNLVMVGAINSVEENGFTVDLGIKNLEAFLPKSQLGKRNRELRVGEVVICKIIKVSGNDSNRCVVQVTINFSQVKSEVHGEAEMLNYSTLLPGMLLKPFVLKNNETGLKLQCNNLQGLIHTDHLTEPMQTPDSFPPTTELCARVLYIHPNLTTPYLTLNTDLIPTNILFDKEDRKMAKTLQRVRVIKVEGRGVVVQLLDSGCKGLISLSHLGSTVPLLTKEDISDKFKENSVFPCYIMRYSPIEKMYLCSLLKANMEKGLLTQVTEPAKKRKQRKKKSKKSTDISSSDNHVENIHTDGPVASNIPAEDDVKTDTDTKQRKRRKSKKSTEISSSDSGVGDVDTDDTGPSNVTDKNVEEDEEDETEPTTKQKRRKKKNKKSADVVSSHNAVTDTDTDESTPSDNSNRRQISNLAEILLKDDVKFWSDDDEKPNDSHVRNGHIDNTSIKEKPTKSKKDSPKQRDSSPVNDPPTPVSKSLNTKKTKEQLLYEEKGVSEKITEAADAGYWILLMKQYCFTGDFNAARRVVETALSYPPLVCKPKETVKIWGALFKLELKFGSEESVKDTWNEALKRTDDKYYFYKIVATSYEKEDRILDAQNIFRKYIIKEYGDKVEAWIDFAKLFFVNGKPEDARNVYHEATNQIQARGLDGMNLTSRFAINEIYHGDVTKGSMMLDALLSKCPLRADIWLLYSNALIKMSQYDRARAVFLKAFDNSWKPQKVKSLLSHFKKFETEHGSDDTRKNFFSIAEKVLGASGFNILPS